MYVCMYSLGHEPRVVAHGRTGTHANQNACAVKNTRKHNSHIQ